MKKVNRIKENPKQGCGREMENKKSSEEVAQKRGEKKNKSYKRAAVTATQICRAKGTRRIYNEKKISQYIMIGAKLNIMSTDQ